MMMMKAIIISGTMIITTAIIMIMITMVIIISIRMIIKPKLYDGIIDNINT